MRNLRLNTITPKSENIALNDLIVATFYQKIKNGKNMEAKTFRGKICKNNRNSEAFESHLRQFESFFGETIADFADYCGHKIIFWCGGRVSRRLCHLVTITPMVTIKETNLIVPAAFQNIISRDFKISDLPRLTLIQCPDFLKRQVETKFPQNTLPFWLAQRKNRTIDEKELEDCLSFRDERLFHQKFGIGFQVFTRNDENYEREHRSGIIKHYKSIFDNYLNLEFVGDWENRKNISLEDRFRLHPENDEKLRCKFSYCNFSTLNSTKLFQHEISCTNETTYNYKQKKMINKKLVARQYLIEQNLLDSDYHNTSFITGDIESFGLKDNARIMSERTCILSEQKIVSISFCMNFGPKSTICLKRESFSQEDYDKFFSEITDYLNRAVEIYNREIPEKIHNSIRTLSTRINEYKSKITTSNGTLSEEIIKTMTNIPSLKERIKMEGGLKYLKSFLKLKVYGFNSEKYDWPIILPGLLSSIEFDRNKIKAIRRGTGLMSVDLDHLSGEICLLDARNYLSGGSLEQFGKTFGAKASKGTFCYEFFESIEDAKNCSEWPQYKYFNSSLSYPRNDLKERIKIAYDLYIQSTVDDKSLTKFFNLMSLDDSMINEDQSEFPCLDHLEIDANSLDPVIYLEGYLSYHELYNLGIITNMLDFLYHYNNDDVEILSDALSKYVELFIKNLRTNPLDYISLPGMAEAIMWSEFDDSKGAAYSMDRAEVVQMIRGELMGGTVNIFNSRHVEINVPDSNRLYSKEVYTVPNGSTIKEVISYDFNNLYGHAMRMAMPVGPGILYDRVGDHFTWDPLMNSKKHKFSLEAIDWLNKMENDLLNPDGSRNVIHHAMNSGEREFTDQFTCPMTNELKTRTFNPDGYALIAGEHHFFEYDGCHFHKCIHNCSVSRKSRVNKNRDDNPRDNFYTKFGHLHKITSCEWQKEKRKNPSYKNFTSIFFNKRGITEKDILEKVKSGDFFGLVRLDLRSPPSVIKHFMKLGFPCIFKHLDIENSMLHPEYQEMMKDRKQTDSHRVLTQTFNADQILITSDTAIFYHRMGLELKNLTRAIEFEKDFPFAKFVNEITQERKKATETGNKALQDIFKLVLNR